MKKLAFLLVGAGLFVVAATTTQTNTSAATFKGTLVDTKCYSMMPKANKGNDHKTPKGKMPNCATACANMGIPVALLDKDGNQHVLAVPANQLADHMAKEARIDGKLASGVLIPEKIEVKEGQEWKEVKIATMM